MSPQVHLEVLPPALPDVELSVSPTSKSDGVAPLRRCSATEQFGSNRADPPSGARDSGAEDAPMQKASRTSSALLEANASALERPLGSTSRSPESRTQPHVRHLAYRLWRTRRVQVRWEQERWFPALDRAPLPDQAPGTSTRVTRHFVLQPPSTVLGTLQLQSPRLWTIMAAVPRIPLSLFSLFAKTCVSFAFFSCPEPQTPKWRFRVDQQLMWPHVGETLRETKTHILPTKINEKHR